MGNASVNPGFGPDGAATYNIWLYKGGPNCKHFWMRQVYMAREGASNVDAKNPQAEVGVNRARAAGAELERNDPKVATRPIDMPNKGYKS